jgi:F-box protein 11
VVADECRFSGNTYAGVEVKGETTRATLRRCRAENGKGGGYVFHEGAGGLLDGCEASGNALSGVEIRTAADPLLRDCILRDNKQSGVLVDQAGRGRIDGGQITGNGRAGVAVQDGGNPMVTGCTITGNGYQAIWISDATGTGTFRGNDLRGNEGGAWDIAEGATVIDEGNLT